MYIFIICTRLDTACRPDTPWTFKLGRSRRVLHSLLTTWAFNWQVQEGIRNIIPATHQTFAFTWEEQEALWQQGFPPLWNFTFTWEDQEKYQQYNKFPPTCKVSFGSSGKIKKRFWNRGSYPCETSGSLGKTKKGIRNINFHPRVNVHWNSSGKIMKDISDIRNINSYRLPPMNLIIIQVRGEESGGMTTIKKSSGKECVSVSLGLSLCNALIFELPDDVRWC